MKRVRWAPAAMRDLQAIQEYFAGDEEDVAQRLIERIVLATDWLLDWPRVGQEISKSGRRKWKPRRTPYVLVYRVVGDDIEVSRVRHEREDWQADL